MAQTNVNIRMDARDKKDFDAFCKKTGLTMSTAFNIFAKTVIQQRRIPFEIRAETDPFWSEENQRVLAESIRDAEAGRLTEHELIEVD